MLSSQQIQYILSLAELKNFGRAAEQCFVTQPTLSMQLKKAENILGFDIFDRNKTPVELTVLGEELLPLLREIEQEFNKLTIFQSKVKGNYKEEIRLGIIPTIASYLIPEVYETWQKQFSSVSLIIEEKKSDELLQDILSRKTDIGILAGPVEENNLNTIQLYNEEIKIYSKDHFDRGVTTEDLKKIQPWLLTKGNCLRNQMINFCGIHPDQEKPGWDYQGGNLEMLIRMVQQFGGYTLVPEFYERIYTKNVLSQHLYSVRSAHGKIPVRNIIGIMQRKNIKTDTIREMLKVIQLHFASSRKQELEVLNWK